MKMVITLADTARVQDVLELRCEKCDRYGRFRVAGLIERYGRDMGLPELRGILSADCPSRQSVSIYDQCQARFLDAERRQKRRR
jgi:hypothetical protein